MYVVSQFCAHAWPAPASSGTAPASSGEVVKISHGAGFWVAMGFYGHVKSIIHFGGIWGPLPVPANLARARRSWVCDYK